MKLKLLLATTVFTAYSFGQTQCTSGFAGSFPCNKVDLLSNLTFPQIGGTSNTQGNGCWGWTDPLTNKEYAIMGCTSHTAFVDITNPVNPIYVGKVESHNNISSIWREIKVYNNHVFIVSEAPGHGLQIFDLTRLRGITTPQTFVPDARYGGFGNCHNIAINEATGFAYCIGSGTFAGGIHAVNIQNPLQPTFSFGYSAQDYTHDAQIVIYDGPDTEHVGKEIFFGCNEDKVVVVDVTNKSNPILLSVFNYSNVGYTHQGWFTENKKYFIVGDELDENNFGFNSRSIVIDMTDLDAPSVKLDYFGPTPAIDHNGYVKGNIFHLANYRAGYRAIDITNIDNGQMNEIAFFDTFPSSNSAQFNGAWSVYPFFASGTILISDIERGLFMVRLNPSLNTNEVQKGSVSITPNPAAELVSVAADFDIKTITVFDILGKKVLNKSFENNTTVNLDVSSLQSGLYFVRVNELQVQKLIKK